MMEITIIIKIIIALFKQRVAIAALKVDFQMPLCTVNYKPKSTIKITKVKTQIK